MTRIVLIVPYFGKLPNYFQIFLESCRHNPTVDWLFFIDDESMYSYPPNVRVVRSSLGEVKKRIQDRIDTPIQLDAPYKLCDYKEAYGFIFSEYLNDYEFWGHCDIDLIFGDIRRFVTDEILARYDKVFYKGHFSLYRNTPYMNRLFMTPIAGDDYWRTVFGTAENMGYDERGIDDKIGMYTVFMQEHIPVYEEPVYASLCVAKAHFQLSVYPYDDTDEKKNSDSVFVWRDGRIVRYYLRDGALMNQEYMYLHMQSHPMNNEFEWNERPESVLIVPNRICRFEKTITIEKLRRWGRKRLVYPYFWKKRIQRVWKRLIRRINQQ